MSNETKLNINWIIDDEALLKECNTEECEIVGYCELPDRCFLAVDVPVYNEDDEAEDTRFLIVRDGLEGMDIWYEHYVSNQEKRDEELDRIIRDYSDTENSSNEIEESAEAYTMNSITIYR